MPDHPHNRDGHAVADRHAGSRGFLCGIENLTAFDLLTEHATTARAIRNLGHAVGDHRDRCPCPDHHCRRLVRYSMSRPTGLSSGLCPELRGFVAAASSLMSGTRPNRISWPCIIGKWLRPGVGG